MPLTLYLCARKQVLPQPRNTINKYHHFFLYSLLQNIHSCNGFAQNSVILTVTPLLSQHTSLPCVIGKRQVTHCSKELKQLKRCPHASFNVNYLQKNKTSYPSGTASAQGRAGGNTVWLCITWESPESFIRHAENVLLTFGVLWAGSPLGKSYSPRKQYKTIAAAPNSTIRCAEEKDLWFGGQAGAPLLFLPCWAMRFERKYLVSASCSSAVSEK